MKKLDSIIAPVSNKMEYYGLIHQEIFKVVGHEYYVVTDTKQLGDGQIQIF